MEKTILKLQKISKYYDTRVIFENVNLEITQEIHAIVGNNSVGKSTLIRMLAGFEQPSKGKIVINSLRKGCYFPRDPSEMLYFRMAYAGQDDFFLEPV